MGCNVPKIKKACLPTSVPPPRKAEASSSDDATKKPSAIDWLFDPFGIGLVVGSTLFESAKVEDHRDG
jgi:hypothetical protein